MLSRFHLVPDRNGRTDGQICYINIARQYIGLCWRAIKKTYVNVNVTTSFVVFIAVNLSSAYVQDDVGLRHNVWQVMTLTGMMTRVAAAAAAAQIGICRLTYTAGDAWWWRTDWQVRCITGVNTGCCQSRIHYYRSLMTTSLQSTGFTDQWLDHVTPVTIGLRTDNRQNVVQSLADWLSYGHVVKCQQVAPC